MLRAPSPRHALSGAATALVLMLVAGLLTVAAGVPDGEAADTAGSLSVSPQTYVAGQRMTFSGTMGRSGEQRIHLQQHMGRPGDSWARVEGSRATTDSAGRFSFTNPAPAMFNIRYRVRSRTSATPAWQFRAKTQESVLSFSPSTPAPGQAFRVAVDTTPQYNGREDLPPPAFPGRTVALQERVNGNEWRTVATQETDGEGDVAFSVRRETAGRVTYRARQADLTRDGHEIGWHPSFPATVRVAAPGGAAPRPVATSQDADAPPRELADGPVVPLTRTSAGGSTNASERYGWNPALWDFAWELGESLTSPPSRGQRLRGGWQDASNGTGRVTHYNGGLLFDSQFGNRGGEGDRGTTTATLTGNAQAYGRWEFRTRSWSMENNSPDFRVRLELVPASVDRRHCGANAITVADVADHSTLFGMGVSSYRAQQTWSLTRSNVDLGDEGHNVAVEVARGHISWFLDGEVVGTVDDPAAVSGLALTPRLSMVGKRQREMNRTKAIFDWARSWTPENGQHPSNGERLAPGRLTRSC